MAITILIPFIILLSVHTFLKLWNMQIKKSEMESKCLCENRKHWKGDSRRATEQRQGCLFTCPSCIWVRLCPRARLQTQKVITLILLDVSVLTVPGKQESDSHDAFCWMHLVSHLSHWLCPGTMNQAACSSPFSEWLWHILTHLAFLC